MGSGRRRQLSQDRKDRLYIHTLYVHAICVVLRRQTHCHVPTAASRLLLNANSQYIVTYESGSRVRLGSGSNESNSSVCGMSRAGIHSCVCGEIYPSLAPESSSPRRTREPGSYVYGQTLTCMDRLLRVWTDSCVWTDSYVYGQTLTCMDRLLRVWTDSYVYGQTHMCTDRLLRVWTDSYVYGQTLTCMDRLLRVWTDSYVYGQTLTCMDRLLRVWTAP